MIGFMETWQNYFLLIHAE